MKTLAKRLTRELLLKLNGLARINVTPFTPSYSEDGLATRHNTAHLQSNKFQQAYAAGVATDSWAGKGIQWRVYTCCWAASQATQLDGDFIECGVNRGGTATSVLKYSNLAETKKSFFLLDTLCWNI